MGDQLRRYSWIFNLVNILIIPIVIWYGSTIKELTTMASDAKIIAEDARMEASNCSTKIDVTCANLESERERLDYVWQQMVAQKASEQGILQKLSRLETHLEYIRSYIEKEKQ